MADRFSSRFDTDQGTDPMAVMGNLVDSQTPGAAGRVMRLADRTLAAADPILRRTRAAA